MKNAKERKVWKRVIWTVEEWGKREIEGLEIIGLRKGEERVKGGEKRVKEGRLGAES